MRSLAVVLLLGTLGAAGAPVSVTVQPSNISFKDALAACPAGTLAGISLTLGHVRISEASGVASDIDDANVNAQVVTLSRGSVTASATVNVSKNSVTAKNVALASRRRVACVSPD